MSPSKEQLEQAQQAERAERSERAHKPRAPGLWRWINGVLLGVIAIAGIGGGIFFAAVERGENGVDRVYAEAIGSVTALSTEAISALFGDGAIAPEKEPWRGVRVYEPEINDWIEFDALWGAQAGEESDDQLGVHGVQAGADATPIPERVVLLVHGLDEPGGIWDQLAPALAGHTVLRFEYPNDQAIARSAGALGEALSILDARGIERVDLVCHSMGGLVAYDAITREAKAGEGGGDGVVDGIGVDHFITIGTPFGGSPWARLRAVAEIREQVQRWAESDDLDPMRLLGFARDGVGEAGEDLLPGSAYLQELDGRTLPAGVRATCIVGKLVGSEQKDGIDLGAMFVNGALGELVGRRDAEVIRAEMDRLSRELGDGVVPMSSAVLDGVSDVVVLSANHRGMVRNVELGVKVRRLAGLSEMDPPPAIEVVVDRLRDSLWEE